MSPFSLGLFLPMAGRGRSAGTLLEELTDEVRAAEAAGLDVVLVPEHHAGPPGSLGDPTTVVTWMLAQTERIRVGPGVLLLPLRHPVHVAEWSALAQHASGQRLVLGLGTGYQPEDFDRFGVSRSGRVADFEAGLANLRAAWRGEGRPKVIPHLERASEPAVWIGAWSRPGVARAARLGDGWLVDPMRSIGEITTRGDEYRAGCEAADRPAAVAVIRELWVDDSDREAERRYRPVLDPVLEYYRRHGAVNADTTVDDLAREVAIYGSPATVTARLVDLVEQTGAATVICTLRQPGGPDHEEVLRAIALLGTEVASGVRQALTARRGSRP